MFRLSCGEEIMTLAFFVLIQYRIVTDGQTDRQTDIPPLAIPAVCIARYANALVKTRYQFVHIIASTMQCRLANEITSFRQTDSSP